MTERRVVFAVSVAAETPHEKLERLPEIIREIIEEQQQVRFGRAHFSNIGDSGLDHEVVYFLLTPDYDVYVDTQHAINLGIMRRFAEEGIQIPYPTQMVYLAHQSSPGS